MDKPAASRSASAEIYVLGLRYKAPAKIDPRLLDVKHLFQGSIEPQRKVLHYKVVGKLTFFSVHLTCFSTYYSLSLFV